MEKIQPAKPACLGDVSVEVTGLPRLIGFNYQAWTFLTQVLLLTVEPSKIIFLSLLSMPSKVLLLQLLVE